MSWYCQMDGKDRRCMDWDAYLKHGWVKSKSFLVWEYQGVLKEKKNEDI